MTSLQENRFFNCFDEKTMNSIQKKRDCENERKKRIFCDKQRIIGIDKNGLDEQINSKYKRQLIEKKQQHIEDNHLLFLSSLQDAHHKAAVFYRTKKEIDCVEENKINWLKKSKFDINDDFKWKNKPLDNIIDGVCSLIDLKGEDIDKNNRIFLQKNEMKLNLDHEIKHKKEKLLLEKMESKYFEDKELNCCNFSNSVEKYAQNIRKEKTKNTAFYNQILQEEHQNRVESEKYKNILLENEEIRGNLNSKFLNEKNIDDTENNEIVSCFYHNALNTDDFKTKPLSASLLNNSLSRVDFKSASILDKQNNLKILEKQRMEIKLKNQKERNDEELWERKAEVVYNIRAEIEKQTKELKREKLKQLLHENTIIALNNESRRKQIKNDDSADYSDYYFTKYFQTSSR